MSIFNSLSQRIHYYLDNIFSSNIGVVIERFGFDQKTNEIIVVYRLGRQKLAHKKQIHHFENDFYEKVSSYDQHRLTKFSTLQNVLLHMLTDFEAGIETFITYILSETKNDQLF